MLQSCHFQNPSQPSIRWQIVRLLSTPPSVTPRDLDFLHPRRCPPPRKQPCRNFSTSVSSRDRRHPGSRVAGKFVRDVPRRVRDKGGDGSRQMWSPYIDSGPADLKSLADSLRGLAENMDDKITQSKIRSVSGSQVPRVIEPPESPLLRRMRRQRPHKRQPAPDEKEPLSNNVWAQMLASPMRCCTATKVRTPSDLMMPWGLMENPNDEKVYVMPRDVTRLEELQLGKDAVMAREGWIEGDASTQSAGRAPSTKGEGDGSTQSSPAPTSSSRLMSPLSRFWMIPFRTMLRIFNDKLRRPDAARRLMPPRWMAAISDDESRHRQFKDPAPVTTHWQVNMDERLLSILQRRVLAAFEGFVRRQERDAGADAGIIRIPLPDVSVSASTAQKSSGPSEMGGIDDMVSGGMLLYVGSKPDYEVLTRRIEANQLSLRGARVVTNPLSSLFSSPENVRFEWQPSSASVPPGATPSAMSDHPLVLATVLVENFRLPVLPILELLSPTQTASIRELLEQPESPSSSHPNRTASDTANSQSYLVLVPPAPSTHPSHLLISESYRLWRFIGGRHHVFPEKRQEVYNDDLFHYRVDDRVIPASYSLNRWQTGSEGTTRGDMDDGTEQPTTETVTSKIKIRYHDTMAKTDT